MSNVIILGELKQKQTTMIVFLSSFERNLTCLKSQKKTHILKAVTSKRLVCLQPKDWSD